MTLEEKIQIRENERILRFFNKNGLADIAYSYKTFAPNSPIKDFHQTIYDFDQEYFPDCISSPIKNTYWIIATHMEEPIAYAALEMNPKKDYNFLARCAVDEKHRGFGLQKHLIKLRVNYSKQNSNKPIITYTHPENIFSSNALISSGFKLFKPKYRFAGKHMLYWKYKD